MKPTDRPFVLYHANCIDGFCAAWLFKLAMPDAELVPVQYGEPPPDVRKRDVRIVDFSYKRHQLIAMQNVAKSFVLLDHHKTAEEDLRDLPNCVFDLSKSGARLAWEHLYRHMPDEIREAYTLEQPPELVAYVEDRDLWRWKLPNSKQVNAAISVMPFDFAAWNRVEAEVDIASLVEDGITVLATQARIVEAHVARAQLTQMFGYSVYVVNATCLQSEIGEELAKKGAFGATYMDVDKNRVWSLRSKGSFDVSELAKRMDGGGHKNAAGYKELLS